MRKPNFKKYQEVINLLESGLSHREIQKKLGVSPNTIQNAIEWSQKNDNNNDNDNDNSSVFIDNDNNKDNDNDNNNILYERRENPKDALSIRSLWKDIKKYLEKYYVSKEMKLKINLFDKKIEVM